jgi:hypothetical protein
VLQKLYRCLSIFRSYEDKRPTARHSQVEFEEHFFGLLCEDARQATSNASNENFDIDSYVAFLERSVVDYFMSLLTLFLAYYG